MEVHSPAPPHPQEAPVALQGDLSSFALPDVLRLLAGTDKSGCLEVSAPPTTGEIWLLRGGLAGGAVSSAPHVSRAVDVVLELLRLEHGTFSFDDTEEVEEGETRTVADTLRDAEALLEEWREVQTVVASMEAWVALTPEMTMDEVLVKAADWKMLAAVGSGGSVRDLADTFERSDLDTSRHVKDLVALGLVQVTAASDAVPTSLPVDVADQADAPTGSTWDGLDRDDLAVLRVDDRPVVMETHDDALLPEPLPGDSSSWGAEDLGLGTVDGRSFEPDEQETDLPAAVAPLESYAPPSVQPLPPPEVSAPAELHTYLDAAAADASSGEQDDAPADDDRESLLKFLSTVKP